MTRAIRRPYPVALALAVLLLGVTAPGPHEASAAASCKPLLKVTGGVSKRRKRAHRGARYRWQAKAARRYGGKFRRWSKAQNRTVSCAIIRGVRKGVRYRCIARGRPCNFFQATTAD